MATFSIPAEQQNREIEELFPNAAGDDFGLDFLLLNPELNSILPSCLTAKLIYTPRLPDFKHFFTPFQNLDRSLIAFSSSMAILHSF